MRDGGLNLNGPVQDLGASFGESSNKISSSIKVGIS
jgi:hypothetical protein